MSVLIRVPITNLVMGGDYTGTIAVGGAGERVDVIIDTGSSTLAVDGHTVTVVGTPGTRTTNLVQEVRYGAGGWVGAVVETTVGVGDVALTGTHLALTYTESPDVFGAARGIFGLAYPQLNQAYVMPADTTATRYAPTDVDPRNTLALPPYFQQLEDAGVVRNKFALYVRRAAVSHATDDPATDPDNHGLLILGAGELAHDCYDGAFTYLRVVHDLWYNTNLTAIAVGDRPPLAVAPLPPGDPMCSNSIIDSGTNVLLFPRAIFDQVLAEFAAIDPGFATALTTYALGAERGLDHDALDLARWPSLHLTFDGAAGAPVTLEVPASAYWQGDAAGRGQALACLTADDGHGDRAILGLPLFVAYYTVFDRSAADGVGVIGFARRR